MTFRCYLDGEVSEMYNWLGWRCEIREECFGREVSENVSSWIP